jgi:type IX secretion system PorP/SprF family membrane protein
MLKCINRNLIMKLTKLYALVFTAMMSAGVKAQQDPQFTQFFFNRLMINPASVGSGDDLCATLIARNQWTGFTGAPFTGLLSVDAPLKGIIRKDVGVGLTLFNDRIGFFNNFGMRVSGSYAFEGIGPGKLRVGLDVGFLNQSLDANWIPPTNLPDGSIPDNASNMALDMGVGVYYHADNFYAGISALHLPQSRLADVNVQMNRHYFVMGGYTFRGVFDNPDLDIQPNVLIKTEFASMQMDINTNVIYQQRFWGGLSYRLEDALALNFGYKHAINDKSHFLLGYSYDLTTSRIMTYSSGSHEIVGRYCMKIEKEPSMGGGFRVRDLDSFRY